MSSGLKLIQKRKHPESSQKDEPESTTVPSFLIKIFEILNVFLRQP